MKVEICHSADVGHFNGELEQEQLVVMTELDPPLR